MFICVPLPPQYQEVVNEYNQILYFNAEKDVFLKDHPGIEFFKQFVYKVRRFYIKKSSN